MAVKSQDELIVMDRYELAKQARTDLGFDVVEYFPNEARQLLFDWYGLDNLLSASASPLNFSDYSFALAPLYKCIEVVLAQLADDLGLDKSKKLGHRLSEGYLEKLIPEITDKINDNNKKQLVASSVRDLYQFLLRYRHEPAHAGYKIEGFDKSEEELAELCDTDPDLGTTDMAIQKATMSFGLKVEIKNNSTLIDIQDWLDKEVPVIVNWFSRGRIDYPETDVPDGHLSVVVGLDDKHIYLQDPEIGKLRQLSRGDFMRVWFDFSGEYIKSWDEMIIRQLIAIYK